MKRERLPTKRTKMVFREGAVRRGERDRHDYSWDLGAGLGLHCRYCGGPKPSFTRDETPCPGRRVLLVDDLLRARERGLPNRLLAAAWARLLVQSGIEMDPTFVRTSKVAWRAAFAHLGRDVALQQMAQAELDAGKVYRAVGADADAMAHHLAACRAVAKLAHDGKLEPTDQPVLQSLAILAEARATQGHSEDAERRMASQMLLEARALGYYR